MLTFFKFTKIYWLLFGLASFFLLGCLSKNDTEAKIKQITVEFSIERFDQFFYETPIYELEELKKKFPYFFPEQFDDAFWIEKKNDTLYRELHDEVEKKYKYLGTLPDNLESFLKHKKYYFSGDTPEKIVTLISEIDLSSKAIYTDSLILISLDTYLGADHPFYKGFPQYLQRSFEPDQILPDIAQSFLLPKIPLPKDRSFLSQMIYQGKVLYAKGLLLPDVEKQDIIAYSLDQLQWCIANEQEIWRYFVENKLLFDTDPKLQERFLRPSPFSKFYLEIDSDSPGRVGAWLGWQIVNSYMKNNNVTLQELFEKEEKVLFEESRYKPKK